MSGSTEPKGIDTVRTLLAAANAQVRVATVQAAMKMSGLPTDVGAVAEMMEALQPEPKPEREQARGPVTPHEVGRVFLQRAESVSPQDDPGWAIACGVNGILAVLVEAFEQDERQREEQDRKDSYDVEMEAGWRAAERVREAHSEAGFGLCGRCEQAYPCDTIQILIGDGYPYDASANG